MQHNVLQQGLEDRDRLGGLFWPAGVRTRTAGVLEWDRQAGARLELIGLGRADHEWPRELGGERITIHGVVGSRQLSLLDASVSTMWLGDIPMRVFSPTVVVGPYCASESLWTQAILVTTNLTAWRNDSGIDVSLPRSKRAKYRAHARWRPPTVDHVRLSTASLRFEGDMWTTVSAAPEWEISTWQQLVAVPDEPLTMAQFDRRYAEPLRAFTTFAADRPDAVTHEVLIDQAGHRVSVLQRSRRVEPRSWRPDQTLLFPVEALHDYGAAISRWWELHDQVWPALGVFADHIDQDTSYSPARFLTLYSGVEAYCRARFGHKDLRKLRAYSEVPSEVTGCTNEGLALIGASRDYFAHFRHAGKKYSLDDIQDNAIESTRRLACLMQACLMRELGIAPAEIAERLDHHYLSWPIR